MLNILQIAYNCFGFIIVILCVVSVLIPIGKIKLKLFFTTWLSYATIISFLVNLTLFYFNDISTSSVIVSFITALIYYRLWGQIIKAKLMQETIFPRGNNS